MGHTRFAVTLNVMPNVMRTIAVVDYDPMWPRVCEEVRATVWKVLKDFAIAVEHVGSTSVPGLAAKPIVDVDVVVASPSKPRKSFSTDFNAASDIGKAIEQLATLGYEYRGDLGVTGREAFRNPPGVTSHHLYVCREGVTPLRNHLALRDYLRSHPDKVVAYGDLKKRLAQQFPHDIDAYIAGKTNFILHILEESSFSDDELQRIANPNR